MTVCCWQPIRGAEQRHPTAMCSRAQKLQQHTGVDTRLSRVTFRTVIDDYGHIEWWALHNSGLFLLLSNLQTTVGCLPPSAWGWLLRSRIRSLQLRTSKCLQWMLSLRLRQLVFSIYGNPGPGSPGLQLTRQCILLSREVMTWSTAAWQGSSWPSQLHVQPGLPSRVRNG